MFVFTGINYWSWQPVEDQPMLPMCSLQVVAFYILELQKDLQVPFSSSSEDILSESLSLNNASCYTSMLEINNTNLR